MVKKSGIIAGIISLVLAIISKIPIFPPENWELDFNIFSINNVKIYFWGYSVNNNGFSLVNLHPPENIIAVILFLIIILIGLNSIMASFTKSNIIHSLKLYRVNIILIIFLLVIFGINIIILSLPNFVTFFSVVGLGYYLTILILILNFITIKSLKKG